jgi:hypothetical protein
LTITLSRTPLSRRQALRCGRVLIKYSNEIHSDCGCARLPAHSAPGIG